MRTTPTFTSSPILVATAREFVRADGTQDDTLLQALINQATVEASNHAGQLFGVWAVVVDTPLKDEDGRLITCYTFTAYDRYPTPTVKIDGATVVPSKYTWDEFTNTLELTDLALTGTKLTATFAVDNAIPEDVAQAILQHVKQAYDYGDNHEWKSSRFFDRVLNRYRTNYTG